MSGARICGFVLAAGAGTRMGMPKALVRDAHGVPWVHSAVRMLQAAGCADVLVALGAEAEAARPLVPAEARIVVVPDWREGLSATLRAGLADLVRTGSDALLITPVDTPAAAASAGRRVLGAAGPPGRALARATYRGQPGHPVLIGHSHAAALTAALRGDTGAGDYLRVHGALEVECGDLWDGADIDAPRDVTPGIPVR